MPGAHRAVRRSRARGRHSVQRLPRAHRQVAPQHAGASLLAGQWSLPIRWMALAVLAVIGSSVAYGHGRALRADAAIPPPVAEPVAVAFVASPVPEQYLPPTELPTLPALPSAPSPTSAAALPVSLVGDLVADGIPATALQAYEQAADREATTNPRCGLPWQLLAAIGRVESNHGRFGGAVLLADGTSIPQIIGIALDGNGTALIRDTDDGQLDQDPVYDRAVGPMQFIPSTWRTSAADGNGDAVADPFNIFDATVAAAGYLCRAGGDLSTVAGQVRAIYAYNNSARYVAVVLQIEAVYKGYPPPTSYPTPRPATGSSPPPVNPGPAPGLTEPPRPTPGPTTPWTRVSTSPARPSTQVPTQVPTSPAPSSPGCPSTPVSSTPATSPVSPSDPVCGSPRDTPGPVTLPPPPMSSGPVLTPPERSP